MAVVVIDMERISSESLASANLQSLQMPILKSEQQSDQEEETVESGLLNEIIAASSNSNTSISSEALDFRLQNLPKGKFYFQNGKKNFGREIDMSSGKYCNHAIKGHRHYSKIMFWTLRLSHKSCIKNHF